MTRSGIGVSTSEDTAGVLKPIFDAAKVQREINAQVNITKTFSQAAPRAIADYASAQTKPVDEARTYQDLKGKQTNGEVLTASERGTLADLEKQGMNSDKAGATLSDRETLERYENWKEGGVARSAAHTVAGALAGGFEGALGAGTVAVAAPTLDRLQREVTLSLISGGVDEKSAALLSQATSQVVAAGIGAAVAGGQGAGSALVGDTNNRQLHKPELKLADVLAAKSRGRYTSQQIADAMRASGNSDYKEDITAGMIVDRQKAEASIYDRSAQWGAGGNGTTFVQSIKPVDPELAAFVRSNTGGANSPYFDLAPPTMGVSKRTSGGEGLKYQLVSANGQSFSVPVADCPAVSCTNG